MSRAVEDAVSTVRQLAAEMEVAREREREEAAAMRARLKQMLDAASDAWQAQLAEKDAKLARERDRRRAAEVALNEVAERLQELERLLAAKTTQYDGAIRAMSNLMAEHSATMDQLRALEAAVLAYEPRCGGCEEQYDKLRALVADHAE